MGDNQEQKKPFLPIFIKVYLAIFSFSLILALLTSMTFEDVFEGIIGQAILAAIITQVIRFFPSLLSSVKKTVQHPTGENYLVAFCKNHNLNADYYYMHGFQSISFGIDRKNRMIFSGELDDPNKIGFDEIKKVSCGADTLHTVTDKHHHKYYISLSVDDFNEPQRKYWFGGNNSERDLAYHKLMLALGLS